jgi:DNA-binding NarL/FixJ family response regulator
MKEIKLALVDDEKMFLSLLRDFLLEEEQMDVIETCYDGSEILSYLHKAESYPDVVIMDLKMKKIDGIEALQKIKANFPEVKVIILSSHYEISFSGFLFKAGVNAYLPKDVSPKALIDTVKKVALEDYYFSNDQFSTMASQISNRAPEPKFNAKDLLTSREKEVLRLICKQQTAKEIADSLFISQSTAEGHKNNLLSKTGVKNTAGLVLYAVKHNLIDLDELPLL